MTIPVDCPHCETRFQLHTDMLGKSMRCPACREVFEVPAGSTPTTPAAVPPSPAPTPPGSGLPSLEVADAPPAPVQGAIFGLPKAPPPVAAAPPTIPLPPPPAADVPTLAPLPDVPTLAPLPDEPAEADFFVPPTPSARSVPTAPPIPVATPRLPPPVAPALPTPKEVTWSGDAAPPLPPVAPKFGGPVAQPARDDRDTIEDDEPFIRRRRRRPAWHKFLFISVVVALVLTLAGIGVGLLIHHARTEERLAAEAEQAYKDGNYAVAQKRYEEVMERFPGSTEEERYKFFAALSAMQAVVSAVTTRENPDPALKAFHQFAEEHGASPFAQPESGFGADVVQAGRRLADTVADHAGDRLKTFRSDRQKLEELTAAERAVEEGRKLLPVLDRFRDKDTSLEAQRKRFEELSASFGAERHRLQVLEPFRKLAEDPTAERIEQFQIALRANKLADDAEALEMLRRAETELRNRIGYTRGQPIPPVPPPVDPVRPVLFAAPVAGSPEPRSTPDITPDVVFAVVRGVLYALDSETGRLVWGARIAPPTTDPRAIDLPVRLTPGDGAADWVLVTGEVAGQPGITARIARTGEPVWYQPLETLPAARPVVLGGRVYVPLRDPFGTVLEFDTVTGARSGRMALRQPIGAGMAVLPGTGGIDYLFVPADAHRVFIFEVGREDADGRQLDPRCVRVLLTEHPRDSLRGEPVLITPAEETGPRFLILTQTDGPQAMKLRAFPLPTPEALAPAGAPAEEPTPRAAEVSLPGWSWFPAQSNGERVVLATDAGAFLAFGVNQVGNADAPLFALPAPKPVGEADAVARSQVVAAQEDAFWVVLGGQLVRLRTAVDPVAGFRIIPQGPGRPVGEPVNRPQVRSEIGLGVVVVRPGGSGSAQAVGFDLQTGQLRWQRRLGVTPAGPPVAVGGSGGALVVDGDGGVYVADPTTDAGMGSVAEVIARPFGGLAGPAMTTVSRDGRTVWVLAPEVDRDGRRLRIRRVVEGRVSTDTVIPLPDQLAGSPLSLGDALLVPVANGYVYRFTPSNGQLTVGPLWKGEGGPETTCLLTGLTDEEFLASDGGRRFLRWRWPAGGQAEKVAGPWEMKSRLALAPAAIQAGERLLFAAVDGTGVVFLFDATRPGSEPLRRWRGGEMSPIPAGRPTDQLLAIGTRDKPLLLYAIDRRHLVALDPEKGEPAWVKKDLVPVEAGELIGWTATADRIVATDQAGRIFLFDPAGTEQARLTVRTGGTVAVGPAVPITAQLALMVLDDGSAATVQLPAAEGAPAPRAKLP